MAIEDESDAYHMHKTRKLWYFFLFSSCKKIDKINVKSIFFLFLIYLSHNY